jgi:hypothetical protein
VDKDKWSWIREVIKPEWRCAKRTNISEIKK